MALAMKVMSLVLALAIVLVATAPGGQAQIGCGSVISYLAPCLPYVTNTGPLGACCDGIRGLNSAAKTTPDRQSVCKCLKSVLKPYAAYISRAAALPDICHVRIPYKISPSTDCAKVR